MTKALLAALSALTVAACDAHAPSAGVVPARGASAAMAPASVHAVQRPTEAPRRLIVPVVGVPRSALRDTFAEARGGARHEAIDIMAPRGTPVVAVTDGRVVKLFTSVPGGLTVYQFDAESRHAYYYAHLDRYADTLREGMLLKAGEPVGFVGSTGNATAESPHLHFAVFELGPDKQWWKGTPIDPYPFLAETPR